MTTTFTGAVHPAAEGWRLMTDDELSSLVDDIRANGLIDPIILTHDGDLVDGRNRLRACEQAGVEPVFTHLAPDADPYAIVNAKNERKNHTTGQQAMGRAIVAEAQGKRKAGRWERGTIAIHESVNTEHWRNAMAQAGYILDIAAKAEAMEPGNGITQENLNGFATLPDRVRDGETSLDAAYKQAQQFESIATLAEELHYKPITDWLNQLHELGRDAITRYGTPPTVDGPMRRKDIERATECKKQFTAAAAILNDYLKGTTK
jgi:hypothetical protein